MKAILITIFAMMVVCFISCNNTGSDYETEQAEFEREQVELAEEQSELEAEQEELRREYSEMKKEYLREKAEFQKEQKVLRKSFRKEHNTNSVKRDTSMLQLADTEMTELTDRVKSAGLWPSSK